MTSARLTATILLLLSAVSASQATIRTVALSGTPAPGTMAGVHYASFDPYRISGSAVARGPVIDDCGRTAFRANLSGTDVHGANDQGVWSEGSGSLQLVARTGMQAPGMPDGMNFARRYDLELFAPTMNVAGKTAFFGGLTDGRVGIWSGRDEDLALVACEGMPAAGTAQGVCHSFSLLRDYSCLPHLPLINDLGQTSFLGSLVGSGVNSLNDWGIWSQRHDELALVARGGEQAHGVPEGANYDSFFHLLGFSDAGNAYFAYLNGSGVDPSNDVGIWSEASGSPTPAARSGTAAPGVLGHVAFESLRSDAAPNSEGHVLFCATLAGEGVNEANDEGLWTNACGPLQLVARKGSPAPGTPSGVSFDGFHAGLSLNSDGQVAFRASLVGAGVTSMNEQGLWAGDGASLSLVARTGSAAPGTSSGVRFAALPSVPALNGAGQTAFLATLAGKGVNCLNNEGIWATNQNGALQLIARTGSQLEVAAGDLRTISDLEFFPFSGFNDAGQIVFWADFNDSQGIFVSNAAAHLPGDFDDDGDVDGNDLLAWQRGESPDPFSLRDLNDWQVRFGRILDAGGFRWLGSAEACASPAPEPTSLLLAAMGAGLLGISRRRHGVTRFYPAYCPPLILTRTLALAALILLTSPTSAPASTVGWNPDVSLPTALPPELAVDVEDRNGCVSGKAPRSVPGPVCGGTNVNVLLGADAFYSQGYTGTRAVMANIEAGHIWNGHETLSHVKQIPNHPAALNEFERHATWVGAVMGGRCGGANPGSYQAGMAPDAQLYSGAFGTQWNGRRHAGSSSSTHAIKFDQYRQAFAHGLDGAGRTADVISSSWGNANFPDGCDEAAIALDAFANANSHTLFVVCAGNDGAGPAKVWSPAAAYNNVSVAALGPHPPYDRPASFSSGGPNDYADPVNRRTSAARQVVDLAAPGENLAAAYYGGETGGNGTTDNPSVSGPGPIGVPTGPLGGADFYTRGGLKGSSFAAPAVAGGAALLYDAAYVAFSDNANARDARVIKAVLMNSADKTIGWGNGQMMHPNGLGGVLTTQGLDDRVGAGRLNLSAAYVQYLAGAADVRGIDGGNLGVVAEVGWDFGQVVEGVTNDYFFATPLDAGSKLTATLTWFRDRRISDGNAVFDDSYDNLDLELWNVVNGEPHSLISESSSPYNETEHFSFALPLDGDYALRVRWLGEAFDLIDDANQEFYGLAWWAGPGLAALTVPESASTALLAVAVMAGSALRRRSAA